MTTGKAAMVGAVLRGSYDYRLVALSVAIAMVASYAALDLAGRALLWVNTETASKITVLAPAD